MTKIYTKTGDKGKTSLFNGVRVLKSDDRVNAYGTIDELNSSLGVAVAILNGKHEKQIELVDLLLTVQQDLFAIGSSLANPNAKPLPALMKQVVAYEEAIDVMTKELPTLKNFILPGGGVSGAQLHMARTICRRAERLLVALSQESTIDQVAVIYLNRLSDLLFTMARYVNHKESQRELIWNKEE
jgi:cob(I)alamin adenosyltransferase